MKLLVVNPNTTVAVTELLARRIGAASARRSRSRRSRRASAPPTSPARRATWSPRTPRSMPAASTATRTAGPTRSSSAASATRACSRCARRWRCRSIGLAEAAMREAASHGRFAIVTGGAAWGPMLRSPRARARSRRPPRQRSTSSPRPAPSSPPIPSARSPPLTDACLDAARGVDAVVLGGAALAGMAEAIASAAGPRLAVPLVDSVDAAARAALARLR